MSQIVPWRIWSTIHFSALFPNSIPLLFWEELFSGNNIKNPFYYLQLLPAGRTLWVDIILCRDTICWYPLGKTVENFLLSSSLSFKFYPISNCMASHSRMYKKVKKVILYLVFSHQPPMSFVSSSFLGLFFRDASHLRLSFNTSKNHGSACVCTF